jgi:hypothetical protein
MDGNAVGHGRAPGGIGAGIEVGLHLEGGELAGRIAGRPRPDPRRMTLGGAAHGFRPAVGAAHRPPQLPGRKRDQGLERDIELAPETAAAGRGDDANLFRLQAHHVGDLVAVHIRRLGAGEDLDPIADAPGIARFRLDIGMLDPARLEAARGDRGRAGEARLDLALLQVAADQDVVRMAGVKSRGAWRRRRFDFHERLALLPGDPQLAFRNAFHGRPVADERDHRFATVARLALGQNRLILDVGIDAESVEGNVRRCQHQPQAGVPGLERADPTQLESGAGMGRADHAQPEAVRWKSIGAEALAAQDLGHAIDFGQTRADGGTHAGLPSRGRWRIHIQHRFHDLAVAGAAAQHAAERILHLGLVRARVAPEQARRGHQHAGRADAALGRAVAMKGGLQRGRDPVPRETFDGGDLAPLDLA